MTEALAKEDAEALVASASSTSATKKVKRIESRVSDEEMEQLLKRDMEEIWEKTVADLQTK